MQYVGFCRSRASGKEHPQPPVSCMPISRPLSARLSAAFLAVVLSEASAQVPGADDELLRQRERERVLQEQLEARPDVRLPAPTIDSGNLPSGEVPCFPINDIRLIGEASDQFQWALSAANPDHDRAVGRCLGASGINLVMGRIQNAVIERGYVTTRVLAEAQDLKSGILVLTVLPGRINDIRFADDTSGRANAWNALPASPGDLLNLRDIEQALENFKRVPTADADIQIAPASAVDAKPGESDVVIAWTQSFPARVSFSLDNSGSKGTGKYQGNIALSLDNIFSLNDLFYSSFTHDLGGGEPGDRGSKGNTLHYSLPFGYWTFGLTSSEFDYHQSVAGVNQSYLYRGESRNNELRLSRMLYRDAVRKTSVWSSFWSRSSENFIDDTEIEIQRRRMAGWEAGVSHREYLGASTLEVSAAYRRGTGAHSALVAPEDEFGEGTSRSKIITASTQLQIPFELYAQRLRYIGSWRAQWNRTPLVPQDRFAIGGRFTVRGFDGESVLSADRGWTIRNELGFSLGSTGQELYAAADYGRVGGPSSEYLIGKNLVGAAIGIRGGYKWIYYDWSWGTPLKKPDGFETAKVTSAFTVSVSF